MDTILEKPVRLPEVRRPGHSAGQPETEQRLRDLTIRFYERKEAAVADQQDFLGVPSESSISRTIEISLADLLMAQRAITALLPGWRMVQECCYHENRSVLVRKTAVEVAPGQYDFVLEWGRQYWMGNDGARLIVDVYVDHDRTSNDSELTFTIAKQQHEWLKDLLPRIKKWVDENHFYRNQAITLQGDYLKFDGVSPLEEVILPEETRAALQRNCIDLLQFSELYKVNSIPLKRGIVLYGPPGTGKTSIGRALAQKCESTFILCTPGMLEESKDVRRAFKWARRFAPSILFFEDVDMIAGSRHSGGRGGALGEFLSGLDGLDSSGGVITIATTNDLKSIEAALKDRPNRFDCLLEIGPLEKPQRVEYLEKWLAKRAGADAANVVSADATVDVARLADKTQGFTGAQMQELCRLAVFEAVEERVSAGNAVAELLPLSDAHFSSAIKKMGKRKRRPVGFVTDDLD